MGVFVTCFVVLSPFLIYRAMPLDYTSECAVEANQSSHCVSAHKTWAAVAVW